MSHHAEESELYGIVAEFDNPESLVAAVERARAEGYSNLDAYSPFPIEDLHEKLGHRTTKLSAIVLLGGILGGAAGFGMQYYAAVISYPLNIGGRPYNSWPSFIPITFELTILFAAFGAVFGMLALNGLPMPYHPIFNVERFQLASRDSFFICIESRDTKFDRSRTKEFLEKLAPGKVYEAEA